ncbi:MAG: T9SS type A sorting domain-containing protein [candidate division Zixibacteria bacterium]|nr:T9SS type A sorting domain-containing protein [candidate division Zixibacteria bacterium]
MKFKLLLTFVLLIAFSAVPAMADESGAKDTIDLIVTVQPNASTSSYNVQLELWVFDDADTLNGATMGFGWDNPKLQMTGAVAGPGVSGFIAPVFFDNNDVALANINRQFAFVGIRLFTPGVRPNPTRQLWATYNAIVTAAWTSSDVVHIDTFTYNSGVNYKFVSSTGGDYFPHWVGAIDVTDANPSSPKSLQISTDTVEFFGVVNGVNPTMQTFTVSEAEGGAISYTASVNPGWVTLGNASGTTPADVEVNVNISGLTEGVHVLPITVASAEADNSPLTVYAKLTLDPQPVLVVPSDTLKFTAVANGDNPVMQTFNVSEFYGGAIAFNAAVSIGESWINLGNASGTTPADVEVNIDITGVTAGVYNGAVSVTSAAAANSPQTVYVRLTVEPQPELVISVDTLYYNAVENGTNPGMQTFSVSELDGAAIPYNAAVTVGDTWISLGNASGTTPADVEVNVNIAGITEGDYLGTIEVTSDTASNSPQLVYVKLSISAQAILLVPTDTLEFTAVENGDNPSMQSFLVAMSDDSEVDFTLSFLTSNTWILIPSMGTTPYTVEVNIDITGVPAGEYFDSIQVHAEGVVNSPRFTYVKLTVANQPMLEVSETALFFNAIENGPVLSDTMQYILVRDFYGGNIPYALFKDIDTYFSLPKAGGLTPDTIYVVINTDGLTAGDYVDSFRVVSDTASNSPLQVYVNLHIDPPPCVIPTVTDSLFAFTTVEASGITDPVSLTFNVASSMSNDNFDFLIDCDVDTPICDIVFFDIDGAGASGTPVYGHTPAEVTVTVDASGLTEGIHTISFRLNSDYENICEEFMGTELWVTIEVFPPPSADTLVIHNAGVSPGGQFMVPVTFTNSCDLQAIGASMAWTTPDIHLDSVSFAESVIDYFDIKNVVINNENQMVAIDCDAGTQDYYPPHSQQNFVNLHFSTSCDIIEAEYPLNFFAELTDFAYFARNCGSGIEVEVPFTDGGSIDVETKPFDFCGWVVEEGTGTAIAGATVELFAYPLDFNNAPIMTATTGGIGSFLFENVENLPFSLWAYKEGYYPKKVEELDMIDKGVMIHLTPIETFAFEPHPWFVNYYCETNIYYDALMPVGSYVEARDAAGNLCGQFPVTTAGLYGFMPVYQDDSETPEIEGMVPGQLVHFFINGEEATSMESTVYPQASNMPPYQNINVCLEVGIVNVHSCDLSDGWNLISWNVNAENDIDAVFGPYMDKIDVILGFEQGGLTYDPDLLQFSTLDYVDHLSGYWVKVKAGQAFTMEMTGSPVPDNTPIMLNKGWNLVSYLPDATLGTEVALDNLLQEDNLLVALGFDDSLMVYRPGWQFSTLLEMSTCHGYWLKVNDNDYLTYPGTLPPVAAPAVHPKIIAAASLNASDVTATNLWVNLYSANLTLDGKLVQAGATISAHTATGIKVGSFSMTKDGEFGFMPVYAGADGSDLKAGDRIYLQVDGVEVEETFTWTNNGDRIEVIQLSAKNNTGNLPQNYSLEQNYPNPFNPSTRISFNMVSEGPAKIEIFNVLGKVVAVPFDGIAGAGSNEITWNGTNLAGSKVASGIYFYRLTAGDFSETKKMMLLK